MNYKSLHKRILRYIKGALPSSVLLWLGMIVFFALVVAMYCIYAYVQLVQYIEISRTSQVQSVGVHTSNEKQSLIDMRLLERILTHYQERQ